MVNAREMIQHAKRHVIGCAEDMEAVVPGDKISADFDDRVQPRDSSAARAVA